MRAWKDRILIYNGKDFATPASVYRITEKIDGVGLRRVKYKKGGMYHLYGSRPPGDESEGYDYLHIKNGPVVVTVLEIDGKEWMVDDPSHWWTICGQAKEYSGNVVCAGLGLGLMAHALRANKTVEKITVVERDHRVIQAISPFLIGLNIEIIHDDWYSTNWEDEIGVVDGVYFDLLVGKSEFQEGLCIALGLRQRFPKAKVINILGHDNQVINNLVSTISEIKPDFMAHSGVV